MSRIARIDLWQIRSPLSRPYPLSKRYGTLTHAEAVLVRITTRDGLEGWGEADPLQPFTEEWAGGAMRFLEERVCPALVDRDALDFGALIAETGGVAPGNPTAKGAVDMALHDLAGKAAGVPVHVLLGGRVREDVAVLWPLGSESFEDSAEVVEQKCREGFETFMIKTGSRDVADDAQRTLALMERFDGRADFMVDANQGWSEAEALRFVHLIGTAPLTLIEQPVHKDDHVGLRAVRDAALVPVSADESVFSLGEAARLATERCVDVFSIKPSKNGGLASSRNIAALAHGHGIGILVNSMIEFGVTQAASLHLGLTLPNLLPGGHAYMSTLRIKTDPTNFGDCVNGGRARASERPGLGVDVDLAVLDRLTVARATIENDGAREAVA